MKNDYFRFQLGNNECVSLYDGYHDYTLEQMVANAPRPEVEAILQAHGLPTQVVTTPFTFLYVSTGKHQVLVDIGAGDLLSTSGKLLQSMGNAGIAPEQRLDVLDTTPESFDRVMGTNLRGAFFLAQQAAGYMLERRSAVAGCRPRLIFIGSVSAGASSPSRVEYCISKAGLSMVARVLADRLAAESIPVFEVRPGIIRTDMTAPVHERYDAAIADGLVPQRRWGEPDDVAKAVAALARGDFDYSTGLIVDVGGGVNIPRL